MLVMGACGIVYEYVLGALGNNLIGSSHEQIFIVIGIMMFAMGLGAALQGNIVGDLLDKFLALEILLGLVGGVSVPLIYASFAYTTSYRVFLYGFALLTGLLIGLEIPLLIRINTEYAASLRTNLSQILSMDYVGSLVGALIFTYVLLVHLSLARISLALGLVNTLIGLVGLLYFRQLVRRKLLLAVLAVVTLVVLAGGLLKANAWMTTIEQRCFEDPIIHRETTRYQHIVLTKRDRLVRLYINGRLQFSSRDEFIYHELLVHVPMAVAKRREDVLILGGGDGLALREVLRYPEVRRVTLVDIDYAITELAARHPDLIRLNHGALRDARVEVAPAEGLSPGETWTAWRGTKIPNRFGERAHYALADLQVVNVDADQFVQGLGEAYDVAILDFPDPSMLELAKLYSVDFYRALARRLRPEAVLAVQSASPFSARKVFLCIGETLRASGFTVLPYHHYIPSFGEWGWHLAWRGGETAEARRRHLTGLERLEVETFWLTPEVLAGTFAFGQGWLEAADIRPNTKIHPVIVSYYREAWKDGS
jgi:spermidine synthase